MPTEFEEALYEAQDQLDEENPEELDEIIDVEDDVEDYESDDIDQEVDTDADDEGDPNIREIGEERPAKAAKKQVVDDTPLIAPHTWPEDYKATFNELPKAAQEKMLDMNRNLLSGFQNKMKEVGNVGRELTGIREAVKGHADRLHRAGIDPTTAITRSLAWDKHITENGPKGLLDMAKAYGFDLSQMQQQTQSQQEYMTPTERQLQQQVQSLTQAFQQNQQSSMQRQQQWQQANRNAHVQKVEAQLNGFMQETSPDGKLAHPFVEHVADTMARLISSGVVQDLEGAYRMAASGSPEINAALERQRVATQQQKAAKARKAGQGVIAKSPDKRGGKGSFESQVRAAYRSQA